MPWSRVQLVQEEVSADVTLRLEEGTGIVVRNENSQLRDLTDSTVLSLDNLSDLPAILERVALFNYFLNRPSNWPEEFEVSIEMHRIEGDYPFRMPRADSGNMIHGNSAGIPSSVDKTYGFTISNDSDLDLFPYLFYFDPLHYSIHTWYSPADKRVPAPLRAGDTVTIGMGSDNGFQFALQRDIDKRREFGFLKLLVATTYLDLGSLDLGHFNCGQPTMSPGGLWETHLAGARGARRQVPRTPIRFWAEKNVSLMVFDNE